MEVLLLEHVRSLGKKNQIVKVPDGFAHNNLIPRKLAIPANSPQAKQIAKKAKEKAGAKKHDQTKIMTALKDTPALSITGSANDKGVLYKSIGPSDIQVLLKNTHHIDIPEKSISIEGGNLKEVGEHTITISIADQKTKHALTITAE